MRRLWFWKRPAPDKALCGDWSGDPYEGGVQCELPAGHGPDHYAEVRWSDPPPRDPNLPPRVLTEGEKAMQRIWAPIIEQHLRKGPVVGREKVINWDATNASSGGG